MRRLRRGPYAAARAVTAVTLTVLTFTGASTGTGASADSPDSPGVPQGVRVSWAPLGLNTAPWDAAFAGDSGRRLLPRLRSAGIGMLRYGGGSFADEYAWQGGVDVQRCPQGGSNAVAPALGEGGCAAGTALRFGEFSKEAAKLRASTFATVNYGTGTPAEAAAWVTASKKVPGPGVALWEIGNETYGCWEANEWLAQPPADYPGYVPSATPGGAPNPTCPQTADGSALGTQIMANSYAANARPFMTAMKAADKWAQIGVPWAFGGDVPGAAVPDNYEWNDTVLAQDASQIGFVDAHYYPFTFSGSTGGGNPTDEQVLHALTRIPTLYGEIRATLSTYDPRASVIVGETNVSNAETTTVCRPVGALFAAGDVLSWLAAGAQSIDWWNMNNYGNTGSSCTKPDFGMFTSPAASSGGGERARPATPYYGYELASILIQPGATLSPLYTSDLNDVLAFQSALPDGKTAVAFLNTDAGQPRHVTFRPPPGLTGSGGTAGGSLRTWTYSAAAPHIAAGSKDPGALADGITLPAESLTILQSG